MNIKQLQGQMKYALEKVGRKYDPEEDVVLTTPQAVGKHLADGREKLASFEPRLGEKLVVMGPAK